MSSGLTAASRTGQRPRVPPAWLDALTAAPPRALVFACAVSAALSLFSLVALSAVIAPAPASAAGFTSAGPPSDPVPAASPVVAAVDGELPPLDVRDAAARQPAVPAGSAEAGFRLRRQLGPRGLFETDAVTGTPRMVAKLDGFLSPPKQGDPASIALAWVRSHAAALGLTAADLDGLTLTRNYTDITGTTHLAWSQSVDGVELFQNGLIVNVARGGRILNVTGSPVPGLHRHEVPSPDFGARVSLGRALRNAGESGPPPAVRSQAAEADLPTRFPGGDEARLVLFADAPGSLRLAWRVRTDVSPEEAYEYVIDADDGEVLFRSNMVRPATGRVWQYAPNIDKACPGCSSAAGQQNDLPFPGTWNTSNGRLKGNNAHVYTDVDDNNRPDKPFANCPECGEIPPSNPGPDPDWLYTFQPNPYPGNTSAACSAIFPQCSWAITTNAAFDRGFGWRPNLRQNGTQVYWYINNFHDWLRGAPFGFTPAAGNFEGDDPVRAEILDGANTAVFPDPIPGTPDTNHMNNANMYTQADGISPRMQIYLYLDPAEFPSSRHPEVNGGDDASILYHEYTHGLSDRLILDATGAPALKSHQAKSMGEGWSDWYAMDYLEGQGLHAPDTAADGEIESGTYLRGHFVDMMRSEGLDCAVNSVDPAACPGGRTGHTGGYTLGDMGKVYRGPEVHADGEIWAQTLWQLRQRLIADLGESAGREETRSLITRAMELSPPDPGFLDMRNAILQADVADGGNDNRERIWSVFTSRGMGYWASDFGSGDVNPRASFKPEKICGVSAACGRITGMVREKITGRPLPGVRIEVRGPANLIATSGADGRYTINEVPVPPGNRLPYVIATKRGYPPAIVRGTSYSGGNRALRFGLVRDWAAIGAGARLGPFTGPDHTDAGCGPAAAFDASQWTAWASFSGREKRAVVRLPRPVNVTGIAVDPGAGCGDDDSASTRRLRVRTLAKVRARAGRKGHRKGKGHRKAGPRTLRRWVDLGVLSFRRADNHRLNVFSMKGGNRGVTRIEVTMLANQRGRTPGRSGRDYMDLSEFQVYGR